MQCACLEEGKQLALFFKLTETLELTFGGWGSFLRNKLQTSKQLARSPPLPQEFRGGQALLYGR